MSEPRKHRILVVEDDVFSRELLIDWLEMEGYDLLATQDLAAGIAAVRSYQPDLVLLDVKLGTEDGLELVSWMRREPDLLHIPVIAVTAHAMLTERERVLQAGCWACISKPVDFDLLRDCL